VLARFREAGEVILNVQHANDRVEVLPKTAQTLFPRRTDAKARPVKPEKQGLIIKREHLIALSFPSDETYEKFRKALLESECPVEANKETRQLKLSSRYEDQIQEVIKKLSNEYLIRLEDITG
jgi:hypothetical protein